MKKIVSKILPIALLVLVMSASVVSAAELTPAVTYDDGKVAVAATAINASAGDVVILATRQNGEQDKEALDSAVAKIVYVDQASASSINFNFIPKTDVTGNTISVFMGGAGADAVSVTAIATNKVILYTNGGTVTDAKFTATKAGEDGDYAYNREVTEEGNAEAVTLPTPVKAGYTFVAWCSDEALTTEVTAVSNAVANVKLYAKYTANATYTSGTGFCVDEDDSNKKIGVISVTAKINDYASAKKFGFYVYRKDGVGTPVTINAENGTLTADGFYTIVFGIPEANFDTEVVIIPFIADANDKVTYGAATPYKVGKDNNNNLGTLKAFKEAFGLNKAN